MRKLLISCLVVLSSLVFAQNTKYQNKAITSTSGTVMSFSNELGGMTASFEEIITGSPASSSIVIKGCKVGTTCITLETYTGNVTDVRGPAIDKIYDYFTVTPTWTGGTSPTVTVNYTVTVARNGTGGGGGGAVTSVAGKTGVVTLIEGDITSLATDLTARELLTNKDTDVTLAANSDTKYPSQKAIKAYVASQLGGGFYQTIQSGGTPVTQRAATNFGAEFSVNDNVSKTDIIINAIAESKVTSLVSDLAGKAATVHTHAESDVTSLVSDLASKMPLAGGTFLGTVNFAGGQTFPGTAATSHTHAASDVISGTFATARLGSGTASASTMLCGNQVWCTTLPTAMMPDLAGDLNGTNGSLSVNVIGINGVLLSGLTTGIYKFTAGVPSTAVAADFPTLNQNTSGTASLATALAGSPSQCTGSNFSQGIAANGNANCATPSGSNPLTLLGDTFSQGASAPIAIHAPTAPDGITQVYASTPVSGSATQSVWSIPGVPVRSSASASFNILYTDRVSIVIPTNNTTATAITVPVVGTANFDHNIAFGTCNMGTVVATYTPTTSHINGNTALKLQGTVAGNNPSCAMWWSDSSDYYAGVFLPTDSNGRLHAAGFPALTGDVSNTAGTLATTVTKLNGTLLSGLATGILKNTTGTGVPSIAVAVDFPTLNQSTTGNSATTTAFATAPTLGTTSQLCRGIDSSGNCVVVSTLPTAMMPALTGDVSGTGGSLSITVTKLNGTSLAGLATGLLKNTTTTGVPSIASVVDIDTLYTGAGKCYLFKGSTPGTNDGCDTPAGSGSVNAGTATHFGYYATSSSAISDAGADFVYDGTHTFTFGASSILDLSASTTNMPGSAGFVPTADKRFGINTTNHTFVFGSNGTTLVGAVAATGTNTATTCTNQVITAVSGIALPSCTALTPSFLPAALSAQTSINGLSISASTGTLTVTNAKTISFSNTITVTATDGLSINLSNAVLASAPGAGIAHFAGGTQTATSSLIVAADVTNATLTGTQLASNIALAGSPTTTTQTCGDNSTKIATSAFVQCPTALTAGTTVTLAGSRQYVVCTGACTITVPVPVAGDEFCVMNDDNVATVITLSAIGSSSRYENTARTAYGTAGTGTFVSSGAVGDKVCLLGRDTTHYATVSFNGTWTAN